MRKLETWLPLLLLGVLLAPTTESRRYRVQQEPEEDETIQYYAAESQEEPEDPRHRQVVLVSSADQYNGLYGQPTAASRSGAQDNYIPSSRKLAASTGRVKEAAKPPPVQTIRNYNKVNDDGSFTFGYEAADGSFKEETRGTDCVVRGKYGYVDPDGNKREFTYVSGNPCDPNAPKDEQDESQEQESNEAVDNGPANYPSRPARPLARPTVAPKPVTLFQNSYDQSEEEEQPEPEQLLRPQQYRRPNYITRPAYIQQAEQAQIYQRPQLLVPTTPASAFYKQTLDPVSITPRPTPSARTQLPATTYRPQLLQVAVTPRPSSLLLKSQSPKQNVDFDAEFQKFQQENSIASPTAGPKSLAKTAKPRHQAAGQIYSSALVFDPTTGQYNTQLYQTLPQTEGDFTLNQRIQPYVHQPQQRPLYTSALRPQASQAAYQQQQAGLQFQNSAQLYAQQRARLQQQQQQQQQQRPQVQQQQQQQLYYYQPTVDSTGGSATGQIDSFLRGHNIQF